MTPLESPRLGTFYITFVNNTNVTVERICIVAATLA
jgi:hypothetical protein